MMGQVFEYQGLQNNVMKESELLKNALIENTDGTRRTNHQ